ncbi:leucine-rich repeat and coiled-coil domain-containing protein 1-like [Elgaria multicarinata webbii]|uniref:leucine-rich repeat and coiled-coil domain-containing protein 1-like n=1 Tax=Elgaria multicarinata webbii TaxID=159646 RepID=UPI002FCD529A
MSHAKSQALKKNRSALNVPEPLKHCDPGSLTCIAVKPRVSHCVVGVTIGNQETRSPSKVGSNPIMIEGKAHASLGEDNNFLGTLKTLQKENLQLRGTLKEKDAIISRLMKIIDDQVTKYNRAIELEKEHQKETERQLQESEDLVKEQVQLFNETTTHYTKIIEEQHTQHAELMSELKKQNEADIWCKEEKIAKLKQYISDTFQEKSREHQQQIDELMREINTFTEKPQILKTKLEKETGSKKLTGQRLQGIPEALHGAELSLPEFLTHTPAPLQVVGTG